MTPLNYPEITTKALNLYKGNFKLFFLLSGCGAIMPMINALLDQTHLGEATLLGTLMGLVAFTSYVYFNIALIKAVFRCLNDEPLTFQEAIADVWLSLSKGLGGYIVFFLMIMFGIFLLILPSIVWYTFASFFIYAQVLEDLPLIASFKRSFALVRPSFFPVLGLHAMLFAIILACILPLVFGMKLMWTPVFLQGIVLTVIGTLFSPFFIGAYTQAFILLRSDVDGELTIRVSE